MNTIKPWYQSKTIWYGIINTLIGITAFVAANPKIGVITLTNGVLVIVLRTITGTAIGTVNTPLDPTAPITV